MAERLRAPSLRCGIDRVEHARVERLLAEVDDTQLQQLFSPAELAAAGVGAARVAHLAKCFAAKEACLKLFPEAAASGALVAADFSVDDSGSTALLSGRAMALMQRRRWARIGLDLCDDGDETTVIAAAEAASATAGWLGRLLFRCLPIRRRTVLQNLRRVYPEPVPNAEIVRLAEAFYEHIARSLFEVLRLGWTSAERRAALVRIENDAAIRRAHAEGKGVLLLTGHFGNFEVATVTAIGRFDEHRGKFHFVRRPLWPGWLDTLVTRRFRRAGLGVLPKKGALDDILHRLELGDAVVFVLDQHAVGRDGVKVDFFGQPAWTFRSLAILALRTGAPVVPATAWRGADGIHVVRFEEALPAVELDDCDDDYDEAIRRSTRAYNEALERFVLAHPEQWFWMHRRWKAV